MLDSISPVILICGGMCVLGIVVVFVLPFLADLFSIIAGIVELSIDLATLGPVPGCGCVVVLGLCAGCAAGSVWLADVLSTCNTADAVNLCRFLP
jgi:hypothetical protein